MSAGVRAAVLLLFGLACACAPPPTAGLGCESDQDCALGYRCGEEARCAPVQDGGGRPLDDAGAHVDGSAPDATGSIPEAGPGDEEAGPDLDSGEPPADLDDGGADAGDGHALDASAPPDGPPDDRDDAGALDAGALDAGVEAGPLDAGPADAGAVDAGALDAGPIDAGPLTPQLFAVHPELAAVGDTVVLEGRFPAGDYVVAFGSVTVTVPLEDETARLSLLVPTGAQSGGVLVSEGGNDVGALPFRVTSFEPRLGAFSTELEQTMAARSLPSTVEPIEEIFALTTGPYLHVIDGRTSTDGISERARIFADGSLGAFASAPAFPLSPRADGRAFVRAGAFLHAFGGDAVSNTSTLDVAQSAAIASDGTLEGFGPAAPALLGPRAYANAVVIGGWVYVLGGRSDADNADAVLDTVERAPLLDGGALGAFESLGALLRAPRDKATAHVVGDWLYVVGGTAENDSIERAAITPDGDLEPFALVDTDAFVGRRAHAGVVLGEKLCLVGGEQGADPIASVQCTEAANVTTLTFVSAGDLRTRRESVGVAVAGNRLLVLGGDGRTGSLPIEWAPIDAGAAPSTLAGVSTNLPNYEDVACAVVGDQLLVTGGHAVASASPAPSNQVFAANLDDDGELGVFNLVATMNAPRARHRLLVHGDDVWVLGGSDGSSALRSIELAPVATLSFTTVPLQLPERRARFYAFSAGGTLHVAGGTSGGTPVATVSCLDLGSLAPTFGACDPLTVARAGASGAVLGGKVFVIGGEDDSDAPSDSVDEAGVAPPLDFTASSLSLVTARDDSLAAVLGGRLYVAGGNGASQALLSVESVALDLATGEPTGNFATGGDQLQGPVTSGCVAVVKNRIHFLVPRGAQQSSAGHFSGEIVSPSLTPP